MKGGGRVRSRNFFGKLFMDFRVGGTRDDFYDIRTEWGTDSQIEVACGSRDFEGLVGIQFRAWMPAVGKQHHSVSVALMAQDRDVTVLIASHEKPDRFPGDIRPFAFSGLNFHMEIGGDFFNAIGHDLFVGLFAPRKVLRHNDAAVSWSAG